MLQRARRLLYFWLTRRLWLILLWLLVLVLLGLIRGLGRSLRWISLLLPGFFSLRLRYNGLATIRFLHMDGKWDHALGLGRCGLRATSFTSFLEIGATSHGRHLTSAGSCTAIIYLEVHHVLWLWLGGLLHLHIDVMLFLAGRRRLNVEIHDRLRPISFWNL